MVDGISDVKYKEEQNNGSFNFTTTALLSYFTSMVLLVCTWWEAVETDIYFKHFNGEFAVKGRQMVDSKCFDYTSS